MTQSKLFACFSLLLTMFMARYIGTSAGFVPSSRGCRLRPTPLAASGLPQSSTRFFSTSSDASLRKELLHQSLGALQIDADDLNQATLQSMEEPASGYDGRFGKSAIKTYRSFLYPKSPPHETDPIKIKAAAVRCAQQVDFLLKRHRSHQAKWVRHHDSAQSERQTFPMALLLDNVRSAFNVGSLFRTADAAGCTAVYTSGITPHPQGSGADKLRKSALGAEAVVESRHFSTTKEAIAWIREELPNYQIIGMETTEYSVPYTDHNYSRSGIVLVLGNEVTGVDTALLGEMDAIVEIPMFGAKNSLNIAACAPVVLYEVIRRWSAAE